MENHFTESDEATFFQLSTSLFILENHFTESTENHFSLKNAFGSQRAILRENLPHGALPNGPLAPP
jgi:hypothetical protein